MRDGAPLAWAEITLDGDCRLKGQKRHTACLSVIGLQGCHRGGDRLAPALFPARFFIEETLGSRCRPARLLGSACG